jgi:hypothetical protein
MIRIADSVRHAKSQAEVQAAKLAIDTRKWIASKHAPKRYGDKIETENRTRVATDDPLAALMKRTASGAGKYMTLDPSNLRDPHWLAKPSPRTATVRARRKRAAWNDEYMFQFLTGRSHSLIAPASWPARLVQPILKPSLSLAGSETEAAAVRGPVRVSAAAKPIAHAVRSGAGQGACSSRTWSPSSCRRPSAACRRP